MFKATFNKETKIWSSPKVPTMYNPDQNLGQLIVKVLELTPDAVTQISADTGVSVSCGEMRDRILKIAAHLSGLGLKQGDVIGVVAANTENLAPLVFACFLLGLPVNPLAPIMVEADIVQMYSKTKPKVIFCDGKNLKIVKAAVDLMKNEAKIFTVMDEVDGYESITQAMESVKNFEDFVIPEVDSNTTAIILCSSGSTDLPKGIIKSHKNLILECCPASAYNPVGKNILFQYSSIFWYSGTYFMLKGTLYQYTRVVTCQGFDRDYMIDVIIKYKVTHTFLPPFAIVSLLQKEDLQPLLSVKFWMVGGSSVPKILCEKFTPFIPNGVLCIGYGCSEQGMLTSNCNIEKSGSSGVPIKNSQFKVSSWEELNTNATKSNDFCHFR
jgi:4-coumarate--CoA ligase